jgi:hypothetical protein
MYKLLPFTIVLFLFAACKKDQDCPKPTGVNGEWEWVQSAGGFGGWTLNPESEGFQIKLVIDDFMYREYKNDSLIFESQYDLEIRPDTFFNTNTYISFETGGAKAIDIGPDTLRLYDMCADCFDHVYKRR